MSKGAFTGTQVNFEAGRRIRERRRELGWSQETLVEQIARDLGIRYDQSSVSDWENGRVESPYAVAVWLESIEGDTANHIKRYSPYLLPRAA